MTFDELNAYIVGIAKQIKDSGKNYQAIVAVGRGGMPVASMLAHQLGVERCEYISYARATGWLDDSFKDGKLPTDALIVDDGAESGGTLKALASRYGSFDSAVVIKRPDCTFHVTYFAREASENAAFVMPFELPSETH